MFSTLSSIKKLAAVFVVGFALNVLWENLHAPLYVAYKGAAITEPVLLRAALFDASWITAVGVFFFFVPFLRRRLYLSLFVGFVFAVCLELWALDLGRWSYTAAMPLLPILGVGLSPSVQLGITAYAAYLIGFGRERTSV